MKRIINETINGIINGKIIEENNSRQKRIKNKITESNKRMSKRRVVRMNERRKD